MAGRSNIELTVSMQLQREALITRQILDGMNRSAHDAGSESAKAWAEGFESTALSQDKRIAKAYEGAVTALSRTDELRQKSLKTYDSMNLAQEREVEARTKLNELEKSGTATTEELTRAKEEYRQATDDSTVATNRHITMLRQAERAESQRIASLRRVIQAQNDAADDTGVGQGLLTIGKYISALRAVAIPVLGVAAASMAAQVASAAAIASQALWLIPGAAAAGAAGIGVLSLATVGFGDAIKDIGDPEKFAEAIQNLSPNAQQAALAIQALMEPLTALKNNVQNALFADFAPMIISLTNQYLPMIDRFASGVASAFNNAAKGLFDQLMAPETQLVIKGIFDDLTAAFENLAPAVAPFTRAILDIISAGSSFLPGIATSIANAAESFASFIAQAQASGDLEQWLRDGLWAVGQLWEAVKALGGAFAELAPIGKEALPGIVASINLIAQAIPPVVQALTKIAPPIGDASKALQTLEKISFPIFGNMTNSLNVLGDKFGWIKELIYQITEGFKLLGKFISPFTATVDALSRFIPGGGATSNPLGSFFGDNAPVVLPGGGGGSSGSPGLFGGNTGGLIGGGAGLVPETYAGNNGLIGNTGTAGVDEETLNLAPVEPGGGLILGSQPTAGLPGYPAGGFPVPSPPPEKGSGGGKEEKVPFSADPSLWSVDAIPVVPVDSLPNGLASPGGMVSNAQNLNNIMSALFPEMPSAGGWRPPDGFNEHFSGEAVDFMTGGNFNLGDAMNQYMLQNAEALGLQYTIWKQAQWFPDGRVSPMEDRGDPTQNHMDHVHARVKPGQAAAGAIAFPGQGAGDAAAGMMGGQYVVDPEAVMRAQNALLTARNDVEEKRLRLLELEAKGNASQLELLTARNNVAQAENKYREAEINLAQARQGKYKEFDSKMKGVAKGISDIGAALADDFGISEGLPGMAKWLTTFLANLAFAPMIGALSAISAANPIQGGHGLVGMMGAQAMANGTYPSYSGGQGMSAAPAAGFGAAVPSYGPAVPAPIAAAPSVVTPMTPAGPVGLGPAPGPLAAGVPAASAIGPAPIGGGIGTGAGFPGMSGPPAAMTPQTSGAPRAASPGGGFQGIGGLPLEAAMTATAGLDLLAPGASQAAQIGIKVANRTAGYIGQLGAIGVGGLLETFLPNNSSIADPSKSWLGKIAAGVAGARPAMPNSAGSPAPAQPAAAGQQQPGQGGGPLVKIDNIVNNTPDSGQTLSSQIARMSMSGYASRGGR